MTLQAAMESSSSISRKRSRSMQYASTRVLASTLAAARGSVRRPISPTTVGASMVARCCRRPGSTLLCTATVPEVITYSLSSGPPSSKTVSPASKLAGSSSSSSSSRSSSSRCRKSGTSLRPGVSRILEYAPLHRPVGYELVAEGLEVGLAPAFELPDRLDDLLVEAGEPPGECAGDAVGELEGRRPTLGDHAPERLTRDLYGLDPVRGPDRRRRPALPQQSSFPHDRPLVRRVYLGEEPLTAAGDPLPHLDPPRGEDEEAARLSTLLDDLISRLEGHQLGGLGELRPLLLGQKLEESDSL